jgi:hypothetical protein
MPRTPNKVTTKVVKIAQTTPAYGIRTSAGFRNNIMDKRKADAEALRLVQVERFDWAIVYRQVTVFRKG